MEFDFGNMLEEVIGVHGLSRAELDVAESHVGEVHKGMTEKNDQMAWRKLPYVSESEKSRIRETADYINSGFDAFVVLGIGGSALGSKAIFSALKHAHYNELSREKRGGVRFYVEDNVDPDSLNALFDVSDPEKTVFHVITKSGKTIETVSQFMIITDILKRRLGDRFLDNVIVTTGAGKGEIGRIAAEYGVRSFTVPEGVGGRFSVLCPVGLLSAAVLNIDIDELLKGAADMDAECVKPGLTENPAYMFALLYTEAMKRGTNIAVMMPYSTALSSFAEWFCQLWAESLGKSRNLMNHTVHAGQTPVKAVGVTDQHSQIQLYNEGPFDKVINFIGIRNFATTVTIPEPVLEAGENAYLSGQTLNKLIESERLATISSLKAHGRMSNSIVLDRADAYALGALFFFYEMATAAAGEFLKIDAFDQPGVEEGKIAAFALMGKKGFEDRKPETSGAAGAGEKFTFSY